MQPLLAADAHHRGLAKGAPRGGCTIISIDRQQPFHATYSSLSTLSVHLLCSARYANSPGHSAVNAERFAATEKCNPILRRQSLPHR
jgi:hypothetical protein